MNINLSQHTPGITKGSTLIIRKTNITTIIKGIILEDPKEIFLMSYAIFIMIRDIFFNDPFFNFY